MTSQFNSASIGDILNAIRLSILKRGYENLRILGKIFRQMKSYDFNDKINKDEFLSGLRDIGILLPKCDAEVFYFLTRNL